MTIWVYKYGGPWDVEGIVAFTKEEDALARLRRDVEERLGPWDDIDYGEHRDVLYKEENFVLTDHDKYVNVVGKVEIDNDGLGFTF